MQEIKALMVLLDRLVIPVVKALKVPKVQQVP